MKISILTNANGDVVATDRQVNAASDSKVELGPSIALLPLAGQTLHEIELPERLAKAVSAEELHRGLSEYLRKSGA